MYNAARPYDRFNAKKNTTRYMVGYKFFTIVINITIILINAFSLTKKQKLYISLKNSII